MLTHDQKTKFSSLKVELIDLNILAYFYVKKLKNLINLFKKSTRENIFEELIALRYIENGIILHLTNLDDDSSQFSFRKIPRELNKTLKDIKQTKVINDRLSIFRQKINILKVKHRNNRIAHLNYAKDLRLDEFLNFESVVKPLIGDANEIGDILWGEKIEYSFKLGSSEGIINFRDQYEKISLNIISPTWTL